MKHEGETEGNGENFIQSAGTGADYYRFLAESATGVPENEVAQEVVDMPVVLQRQVATIQRTQKTVEVPQMQYVGKFIDVPVLAQHRVPTVRAVQKAVEVPQDQYRDRVANVRVVLQRQVPQERVQGCIVDNVESAELLRFNTSECGDEQVSFKEYVERMKEGQHDIYYITGESIAVVSSRSFREYLRKKGHEVPYMADPVDEYAVHQLEVFDGTKLKPTMKEGLDLGDQDEKKTLE